MTKSTTPTDMMMTKEAGAGGARPERLGVGPQAVSEVQPIVDAISVRRRFVLSSHSRPDGDSIGSQLALAYALRALGKEVEVVNADPAPGPLMTFPGAPDIRIAANVGDDFDAAIILECSDLARTGVTGLDQFFVINIDHHPGNSGYGQLRWFDPSAAACGEMVFELVRALGAPLTLEVATHIYLAILTDTGSFHYSSISPRTFDICRQVLEAGVNPVTVARSVYDSNNMGRLKLFGAVLSAMQLDSNGRIAIVYLDHEMARAAGGTYEDTEGLINLPLTVKEIQAVVFFKQIEGEQFRVSMRSKGEIDIGAVAKEFAGGGHKNAAGCSVTGAIDALQKLFIEKVGRAIQVELETRDSELETRHSKLETS
ncbi:MAG TPA: bifunctional oligoribonuclease/PAP phosphatase NrnA [Vicinamibacterales bacterium]|nr:bifunctional oligoribonuclease/PAP phosphatase NrnA [Vicinamibacterales bacterium]